MNSVKKSVMLHDNAVEIMQKHTRVDAGEQIAWSKLVNRGIITGDWLYRQSLPDLTDAEWQVILNAYAGTCETLDNHPYRIASDLMDDLGIIDVDQHPQPELLRRLHGMNQAEQFAVLVFVERFWTRDWSDAVDFNAIKSNITG